MKDQVVETLCSFSMSAHEDLNEDVEHEAVRRVLDLVGVALGSLEEPAPRIVREYVSANYPTGRATVWGTGAGSTLRGATAANGVAVRCLDFNDGYMTPKDGCHPSDMIPGLIAVGEMYGRSGREVTTAIATAYDVSTAISGAIAARRNGWDHTGVLGIAAACGAGRLMGLSLDQLREAVSIAAIAHNALRQSRFDELTMWKSMAASYAIGNALESCLLAASGVEGPSRPFEGTSGYIQVLGKHEFDWEYFNSVLGGERMGSIRQSHIKMWPLGQVGQSSVDVAVRLHSQITDFDQIDHITISTFAVAAEVMDDPEKWAPTTRESADHSLVYATIAGLCDGTITHETFHEDRLASSGFIDILREKVTLEVRDDFTARYPECQPARVRVRLRDGQELVEECSHPRGHAGNKATDADVEDKFRRMTGEVLGTRTDTLLDTLRNLTQLSDLSSLTAQLVV